MSHMFYQATSFNQPLEKWDVSNVTNMERMFDGARSFHQPLERWDVRKVTNMKRMYCGATSFNQPLEKWDVSNVTNMELMFYGAISFHQPLERWDVRKVTNMKWMYCGATSFNQPLEKWDVSQVTNMYGMFCEAKSFNHPLGSWDVKGVKDMHTMFYGAASFNHPLEKWDVKGVKDMGWMFSFAKSFNQPLEKWDVSQVTDMRNMFYGAASFNQDFPALSMKKSTKNEGIAKSSEELKQERKSPNGVKFNNETLRAALGEWLEQYDVQWIHYFPNWWMKYGDISTWDTSEVTDMSNLFSTDYVVPDGIRDYVPDGIGDWDVSQVTNMSNMFSQAYFFNQPLEKWDVSQVTDMSNMFSQAYHFNQPLEKWDVRGVTTMEAMFRHAESFNQPLEKWDVRGVKNMRWMFDTARAFNQPLEKWDVRGVIKMNGMFNKANAFNQPLEKWSSQMMLVSSDMFYGAESFNQDFPALSMKKSNKSVTTDAGRLDSGGDLYKKPYYLFFDTETSGLPTNLKAPITDFSNWPRLVQLAYLLYDSEGTMILSRETVIKPNGFIIPKGASDVHGITTELALRNGKEIKDVLSDFEDNCLKSEYLVAHNINFDSKVMGSEFLRNTSKNPIKEDSIRYRCTMTESTDFCGIEGPYGLKWPTLSELHIKLFGEDFEGAHDALADIEATARCFWELRKRGLM